MADPPTDVTAFRIAAFEPNRWMLWQKPDSTSSWRLDATATGGTRLVVRLKQRYDLGHPGPALLSMFLMEFADFAMMRRQLQGLERRAEGRPAS